jgi:hypothetical protein
LPAALLIYKLAKHILISKKFYDDVRHFKQMMRNKLNLIIKIFLAAGAIGWFKNYNTYPGSYEDRCATKF